MISCFYGSIVLSISFLVYLNVTLLIFLWACSVDFLMPVEIKGLAEARIIVTKKKPQMEETDQNIM